MKFELEVIKLNVNDIVATSPAGGSGSGGNLGTLCEDLDFMPETVA